MASCSIRRRKDGTRYIVIRYKPHKAGMEYYAPYEFPQTWSDNTALKRAAKVAEQFSEDCRAGKIAPKRKRPGQEGAELRETDTLRGYANNVFLPLLSLRASRYTLNNYKGYLKNHVFPVMGDKPIASVQSANITALLLEMQGKGYKVATCIKVYAILQGIFGAAFDDETIEKNPMHRVKRPRPTASEGIQGSPPAYTAPEVREIIEAAEELPIKWRAMFRLFCETGCRRGEALGLKWADVNAERGTLSFVRSLGYTEENGFFEKPPKNGRGRTVFPSPVLFQLLEELRQEQVGEIGEGFPGIVPHSGPEDYVFQTDCRGVPMLPATVTRKFARFGQTHGFNNLHPHKLRHSFASIANENGADIAAIAASLGHTNPATTMRIYTHTNNEAVKRAGAAVLGAIDK